MNEWLRWKEDIAFDMIWGLDQSWKKYQNSNFQSSWEEHGYRALLLSPTWAYSEPSLVGRILEKPSGNISTCHLEVASTVAPTAQLEMAVHVMGGSNGGRQ